MEYYKLPNWNLPDFDSRSNIIEGSVTRGELEAAGASVRTALDGFFTADLPLAHVDDVSALPGVRRITGGFRLEPALDLSVHSTLADQLRGPGPDFTGFNGEGVLVGLVDTGVDLHHPDFSNADGTTRILGLWDQTDAVGPPPAGYSMGSYWTGAQIDAGLSRQTDTGAHGSHVLGIACGDGSGTDGTVPPYTYAGMAPRAHIAVVKTDFVDTRVVDGVSFLFEEAGALPAVVNLSLGYQWGPHDGTSALESMISAMTGPGRLVCAAVHNHRGIPLHAEVFAAPGGASATLEVSESDADEWFFVDGYYDGSEELTFDVETPSGTIIGPTPLGTDGWHDTPDGQVYVYHETTSSGDREVYVYVQATAGESADGTWTLTFDPVVLGDANGEVDLWRAKVAGITANFVQGVEFAEMVTEPANAEGVIAVAAYSTRVDWTACNGGVFSFGASTPVGSLSSFTNPGPTRDGRERPDVAAPGIAIASTRSFDRPGACPLPDEFTQFMPDGEHHVTSYGTSMATPHVTGALALLLQADPDLTPDDARQFLASNALADSETGSVWNADWGHGKLRLPVPLGTHLPSPPASAAVRCRPNPSGAVVRISFSLRVASAVTLSVFDVAGRHVETLIQDWRSRGSHDATWDGLSVEGQLMPPGVYFIRLTTDEGSRVARIVRGLTGS